MTRHGFQIIVGGLTVCIVAMCCLTAHSQEELPVPPKRMVAPPVPVQWGGDINPPEVSADANWPVLPPLGEQEEQIDRINQLIRRIKKHAKDRRLRQQASKAKPSVSPPPRHQTHNVTTNEPPILAPTKPFVVPLPPTDEPQPIQPAPIALPEQRTPIAMSPTVDSLALANNLFAQGKVESAQPIYERLLKTPQDPATVVWIQYQLACCFRERGQTAEATKLYRIVSSTNDDPYWASRAQWWLSFLSKSDQLAQRRKQIEQQLQQLREATDGLRNRRTVGG